MTIFTVDVSHHDWDRRGGDLDWAAVRAAGIGVMCARASYGAPGGYHPDTRRHADLVAGARRAGLLTGGYHNLVAGDAAFIAAQVQHFRAELAAADASWAMLDVEPYPALVERGLAPRWADVLAFQDRWRAVDRRPLACYLARWVWEQLGRPDLSALHGPLVSARYVHGDTAGGHVELYERSGGDTGPGWVSYGGAAPVLWQFTSSAQVPGGSNRTDVNAYRGTLANLHTLLTGEPMVWRVAKSLETLHTQLRPLAPNAPAVSFGTIGDTSHTSTSDHSPQDFPGWGNDIVTAKDFPKAEDLDPRAVLEAIRRSRDPRVKYGISNGQMFSSYPTSQYPPYTWRPYTGRDGHFGHGHLSTVGDARADDTRPWAITLEEDDMAGWGEFIADKVNEANWKLDALKNVVGKIAEKVDIDPAELAAITAAAEQGAREGATGAADALAGRIIAGLPGDLGADVAEKVAAAVRGVFADAATPDTDTDPGG